MGEMSAAGTELAVQATAPASPLAVAIIWQAAVLVMGEPNAESSRSALPPWER